MFKKKCRNCYHYHCPDCWLLQIGDISKNDYCNNWLSKKEMNSMLNKIENYDHQIE